MKKNKIITSLAIATAIMAQAAVPVYAGSTTDSTTLNGGSVYATVSCNDGYGAATTVFQSNATSFSMNNSVTYYYIDGSSVKTVQNSNNYSGTGTYALTSTATHTAGDSYKAIANHYVSSGGATYSKSAQVAYN